MVDLNWQIAHGVLYTGARLAINFRMRGVNSRCFFATADETLEHLFYEYELARLLMAWVYMNLHRINPTAGWFTVDELVFGSSSPSNPIHLYFHAFGHETCHLGCSVRLPISSEGTRRFACFTHSDY